MRSLFKPSPLAIAVEQLENAKRELLLSEAAIEDYVYHCESEKARAYNLRLRINRLKNTITQMKKEDHEADPN